MNARRHPIALAATLLMAAPPHLQAQSDAARTLSPTRVAAQVATGTIGAPVGFLVAGVVTDLLFERAGLDNPTTSRISLAAGWTGAAMATAAGPALIGARGPGSGHYPAAVGGAVAGGLLSWGIVHIIDTDGDRKPRGGRLVAAIAGAAVFLLPSAGATTAYNLSRRR